MSRSTPRSPAATAARQSTHYGRRLWLSESASSRASRAGPEWLAKLLVAILWCLVDAVDSIYIALLVRASNITPTPRS
jgi:hypothetical protein